MRSSSKCRRGDDEKKPRLFQFRKDTSSSREVLHVVLCSNILVISRAQFETLRAPTNRHSIIPLLTVPVPVASIMIARLV